jgi:hypothetical protein
MVATISTGERRPPIPVPLTGLRKVRPETAGMVASYCLSCSHVLGWIWFVVIGAGQGAGRVLSVCQLVPTSRGAQCR